MPPTRVTGTAVFMTAQPRGTPPALAHNLRYNKILHEHVIVLTVRPTHTPYVPPDQQVQVQSLGLGLFNVRVQYGFMQDPDVPSALLAARELGVELDLEDLTYFLGRETIIVTGVPAWRCGAKSCSSSWHATPYARRRSSICHQSASWSSACRWKCRHRLLPNAA